MEPFVLKNVKAQVTDAYDQWALKIEKQDLPVTQQGLVPEGKTHMRLKLTSSTVFHKQGLTVKGKNSADQLPRYLTVSAIVQPNAYDFVNSDGVRLAGTSYAVEECILQAGEHPLRRQLFE